MLMIFWPQPRLAVAGAPGIDSNLVERVDSGPVCREQSVDM